jgi:hypothetical protein
MNYSFRNTFTCFIQKGYNINMSKKKQTDDFRL